MSKLTVKQTKFVREYLKDFNGTRAAIAAGYSKKTAHVQANENLKKPNIMEKIRGKQSKTEEKAEKEHNITEDNLMRELARVAFSDVTNIIGWENKKNGLGESFDVITLNPSKSLKPQYSAAIESVKTSPLGGTSIKMHKKIKAIELLMKKMGLLNDDRSGEEASKEDHEAITNRISQLIGDNEK